MLFEAGRGVVLLCLLLLRLLRLLVLLLVLGRLLGHGWLTVLTPRLMLLREWLVLRSVDVVGGIVLRADGVVILSMADEICSGDVSVSARTGGGEDGTDS